MPRYHTVRCFPKPHPEHVLINGQDDRQIARQWLYHDVILPGPREPVQPNCTLSHILVPYKPTFLCLFRTCISLPVVVVMRPIDLGFVSNNVMNNFTNQIYSKIVEELVRR